MFDQTAPVSNTRLEEITMSTATLTAVTLAAAPLSTSPVRGDDGSAGTGGLVLTRRGRRLVRGLLWSAATGLTAVGLVLLWLAVAATVAPGAAAGDGREVVTSGVVEELSAGGGGSAVEVVVGPGDTLWEIARTHAPDRDPRAVVADIVAVNDLAGTGVQVGARIAVPTS